MKLNIKNQIRKLSSRINIFSVINEAVINSIQAGSTKIKLEILRETNQAELLGDKPRIVGLNIVYNGAGFTPKNIASFCEYGSEHKINEGCKGIGRLCYLKVFEDVRIESFVLETKKVISLEFTDHFSENDFSIKQADDITSSETTISLRKIKNSYSKATEIKDIRDSLYFHILPILYLNSKTKIEITIVDSFDKSEEYIKTVELPKFEQANFFVKEFLTNDKKDIEFTLHYSITTNVAENLIDFYCANKRTVCGFKDKELKILPIKDSSVIFLVTSPHFDSVVNDERDDFDIYPKETNLTRHLSWEQINNKLKDALRKIIYENYPSLEVENKKIIQSIKEENLHLVEYMGDIDSLGGLIDSETIIEKAEQLYQQDKKAFRATLKNKSADGREIITKASDLAGKELIEYIITRDKIINQFELLDLAKVDDEEIVRNHFLKRGLEGKEYSPVPVKQNNLWLLDDRQLMINLEAILLIYTNSPKFFLKMVKFIMAH